MMKRIIMPVLMLLLLAGCIEQVDLTELNGPTSRRIVVEGTITNQRKAHVVTLTRTAISIPEPDSRPEPVLGAIVSIGDGTNTFALTEIDTLPGVYATESNVQGVVGNTYTLTVQVEGETYTGSSTMVPVSDFTPEREIFQAPNRIENPIPDNFDIYEVQFPKVRYGVAQPSKVEYYAIEPVNKTLRTAFHYEFPGVDPQGFLLNFQGKNERLFVEDGTEIVQVKYSITTENYEFMRAVFAQTDFKGGLFDRISANVPTNMSNGALGFFGASAVITRTITFNRDLLD